PHRRASRLAAAQGDERGWSIRWSRSPLPSTPKPTVRAELEAPADQVEPRAERLRVPLASATPLRAARGRCDGRRGSGPPRRATRVPPATALAPVSRTRRPRPATRASRRPHRRERPGRKGRETALPALWRQPAP